MRLGVILANFGEPENATEEEVVPFLERIFSMNNGLEGGSSAEQARARSRELAKRRAPGLIEEYRAIGGSPFRRQAAAQAEALAAELTRRGHDAVTYVGMQFTSPAIADAVAQARADGVERLVALPVYPLCGTSTTVAALRAIAAETERLAWEVDLREVSGWHCHPVYTQLRADGITRLARDAGVNLQDPHTRLVFSAHGIPLKYLREGNRYDLYVEDSCRRIAAAAGVDEYAVGYQNHTNRPVEWTQPDIEQVIETIDAGTVVVMPVSFMHEQSETLSELDIELKGEAEARGLRYFRVPVPHDDPRFAAVLADLVETVLATDATKAAVQLLACRCRQTARTRCTNGALEY